jgi:hypothetical protein
MAQRQRKERRRRLKAHFRTFWAWVIGLPLLGFLSVYFTYTYTGADGLRTEIYEPLYEEVGTMERCLQSNVLEQGFTSQTYSALQKTGKLVRVPKSLRDELQEVYAKGGESWGHLFPVLHRVEILIPERVRQIRNAEDDAAWTQKTVEQLNREMDLRGLGGIYARFQFQHTGHSFAIDQRDPTHPKVSLPAGVRWDANDWLSYPKSVDDIEKVWKQDAYLEFHPKLEIWLYRITGEDLARNHLSLKEFLQPTYVKLSDDPDFQQLASREKDTLELTKDLKQKLAERVDTPKKLRDLIFN